MMIVQMTFRVLIMMAPGRKQTDNNNFELAKKMKGEIDDGDKE